MHPSLEITWLPIEKITPYIRNAKSHPDAQIVELAESIKRFGWTMPIMVDKEYCIVAGHCRFLSAKHLGLKTVPVNYRPDLSESDARAYRLLDNRIADTPVDPELVRFELAALKREGVDPALAGFNVANIDHFIDHGTLVEGLFDRPKVTPQFDLPKEKTPEQLAEDERADTVPGNPTEKILGVNRGDVWILGNHRLMCGDSTSIDDVNKLMNGEKANITFTSPPYNAAKNGHLTGSVKGFDKKYNNHSDELTDDGYLNLLNGFTKIALDNTDYCFVNIQLLTHNRLPLFKYQESNQSFIKDVLIWNKKQCPPNIVKGAFNTKWEYIFCFSQDIKTRGFPCDWRGQYPNVVETESNAANAFAGSHKAGYPVALPLWFLEKFDFVRSVYDPFGGTGTTIIACEKTDRRCFMMELDEHYCGVILRRWCEFTGNDATREADGALWSDVMELDVGDDENLS
jgi:DNA modification methylase